MALVCPKKLLIGADLEKYLRVSRDFIASMKLLSDRSQRGFSVSRDFIASMKLLSDRSQRGFSRRSNVEVMAATAAAAWSLGSIFFLRFVPDIFVKFILAYFINSVLWWPSGRHDKLISIDDENLFLWTLDCSKKAAQAQSKQSSGMLHYLSGGAWDQHDINAVATTCESSVQFWDLRTMKKTNAIECAHIRNANYDMKNNHILVTAEDESGIHIWDIRKPKSPVKDLPGHTHLTWAVTCNPEYDGLSLSAGTDSTVNLWMAPTSAEDEATSESIAESPTQQADPLLNSYSDYEDSVYGLTWSSREPWIFASLSYDGRVVVESVKPFLSRK
ncbi:WD repeat-containing protein DWA2-like [Hibiscus syriacus]|uniref:WD repeat-containing protein DWA2-like n=1 Tax=Hibiscus syriacus TaxID=106335 RepID=UPI00192297B9|nr:WD repeat-containing protein DWA2-like [Hibiscus syriacus]